MKRNIEKIKEEKNRILNNVLVANKKYSKLLTDEKVQEFLKVTSFVKEQSEELDKIEEELELAQMENCLHMFICTSPASELGNVPVYHCLRCGLTNLYSERYLNNDLSDREKEISRIYERYSIEGMKLKIVSNDIDFYREKLKELELADPLAPDVRLGFDLQYLYRKSLDEDQEKVKTKKGL